MDALGESLAMDSGSGDDRHSCLLEKQVSEFLLDRLPQTLGIDGRSSSPTARVVTKCWHGLTDGGSRTDQGPQPRRGRRDNGLLERKRGWIDKRLDLFWRHVGQSPAAHRHLSLLRRVGRLGEVEIEQLRAVGERKEYVRRLDVAVERLHPVRIFQRSRQDISDPGHAGSVAPEDGETIPAIAPRHVTATVAARNTLTRSHARLVRSIGHTSDQRVPENDGPTRPSRGVDATDDRIERQTWPVRHGKPAQLAVVEGDRVDWHYMRMIQWPLDLRLPTLVERNLKRNELATQRVVSGQEDPRRASLA
jgi:hypothetical protein